MRRIHFLFWLFLFYLGVVIHSANAQRRPIVVKEKQELRGIDAIRQLYQMKRHDDLQKFSILYIWQNPYNPEVLYYLTMSNSQTGKPEEAAVWATLFLRVAEEEPEEAAKWKKQMELLLSRIDKKFQGDKTAHAEAAPQRKFTSPESVEDGWMTQARSELHSLHSLYAFKLAGGRKNFPPDWVHNAQGAMHRSGMKYMDEVEGRKGLLFGVPMKKGPPESKDAQAHAFFERYKHPTHVRIDNPGGNRVLRIGTRGYGFPYLLRVLNGESEIFSQTISDKEWADLKIDLPDPAPPSITLELTVPEGQQWMEGVYLDYADFFID